MENYSIAVIIQHTRCFYNFESKKFQQDVFRHTRTKEHFNTSLSEVVEICKDLFNIEQAKDYGSARTIFLISGDKLIKSF